MRFLCRIGWHEYGKFEEGIFEVITYFRDRPLLDTKRIETRQIAYCKHCNKRKINE